KNRTSTVPLATTTFNTGFIETGSILLTLAAALESLYIDNHLWPQITGNSDIDSRRLLQTPEYILILASTDLGYNYSMVFKNGKKL
ncbi:MAG: hypothetical protein PVI26_10780, partial [Chitinispirillia bacterium]